MRNALNIVLEKSREFELQRSSDIIVVATTADAVAWSFLSNVDCWQSVQHAGIMKNDALT